MIISIGTNTIEKCPNPISISGIPLFTYKSTPEGIKINFKISSPPARVSIHIDENKILEGNNIELTADKDSAFIFLKSSESKKIKLFELYLQNDIATINIDLRPISLHIYTDSNALYIGGAQLSGNIIKNCTNGIAIG
ncbi:MAG TPA: hypothetical protein VII64_04920 [Thermodesulfobacteriota bacterium]